MRKWCLCFLYLFLVTVSLFSMARKEERFRVWNFSDKDLIVYFELNDFSLPVGQLWYIDMLGINVEITQIGFNTSYGISEPLKTGEIIIDADDNLVIAGYLPFPNSTGKGEEYIDYYDILAELSFEEKMRVIFKTLSIRTIEGEYIIRDLDVLFSANIINGSDGYFLEIY